MSMKRKNPFNYQWVKPGDLNAFFGLMLDNVSDLVILTSVLIGIFHFPSELVLYRMVPGSAIGVLFGDIVYTWMAFRLARKQRRHDVTAMPLGLDTPSSFGLAFGVLGPAFALTKDPVISWKIAMAVIVVMGVIKIIGAWCGQWVRSVVPRAGLLGSIAGVALLLIAFIPTLKIFADPVTGLLSLGIILTTLIAKVKFPFRLPGAFAGVLLGTVIYYLLVASGISLKGVGDLTFELKMGNPLPTLGFVEGMSMAWQYLPLAIPFAIATVIGGIDVTESAAVAGDEYDTRTIIVVEGIATVIAGICGGVIQSTPYIGHPAYKGMGGRAGYTLATAIFIGLGGIFGFLPAFIKLLPEAAVAPILIFIGLEITAQAFESTPREHSRAVAISFIPSIAILLAIELGNFGVRMEALSEEMSAIYTVILVLGNGFILSAMIWGGGLALIIDRKFVPASLFFAVAGVFSLFGIIHSPLVSGELFLPWRLHNTVPLHIAGGYLVFALFLLGMSFYREAKEEAHIEM